MKSRQAESKDLGNQELQLQHNYVLTFDISRKLMFTNGISHDEIHELALQQILSHI